ncbi:hypothetical protein TAO_0958 [Candidatus Nitrosoglobus terrae]|uniref:Uncharacterized protein n=1 Tax=Candidatus Nitrosoglobus terrae TaxID=1630141 RepID=A0A1Q2SMF9_9GAMM|nr:hypothetical protein TAO_0958 [Candidatus Nitrosoglobus terrae]
MEVRASIAPQQGDLLALPATDVPIVNPAQQAIRVTSTMSDVHGGAEVKQLPADELFMVARKLILQLLTDTPKKDKEIARELGINSAQTKAWLERLVNEKKIEKRTCPVSYTLRSVHDYK